MSYAQVSVCTVLSRREFKKADVDAHTLDDHEYIVSLFVLLAKNCFQRIGSNINVWSEYVERTEIPGLNYYSGLGPVNILKDTVQ